MGSIGLFTKSLMKNRGISPPSRLETKDCMRRDVDMDIPKVKPTAINNIENNNVKFYLSVFDINK